jgi:cytochrome b6-f complex iron-sulfur subunit
MKNLTRRETLQLAASSLVTLPLLGQFAAAEGDMNLKIGALEKLKKVGDALEFQIGESESLLVRIAKPSKASPRVYEFKHGDEAVFVTAFTRTCTHQGCPVDKPNAEGILECGCHGSRFTLDGAVVGGPARVALQALTLKLEAGEVIATGFLRE